MKPTRKRQGRRLSNRCGAVEVAKITDHAFVYAGRTSFVAPIPAEAKGRPENECKLCGQPESAHREESAPARRQAKSQSEYKRLLRLGVDPFVEQCAIKIHSLFCSGVCKGEEEHTLELADAIQRVSEEVCAYE